MKRLLSNVSIVSFDIFDTAILRRIKEPIDVFSLVQRRYSTITGKIYKEFSDIRVKAEQSARMCASEQGVSEVTLDQIYDSLPADIPLDVRELLKKLEIEAELQVCFANPYIRKVFDRCLSLGKRIVFTSDFYFSKADVSRILSSAGYVGHEAIFLSSEYKLTKSEGGLFDVLVRAAACSPSDILHIGDNYHSDIIRANSKGIRTIHYERCLLRYQRDRISWGRASSPIYHGKENNELISNIHAGVVSTKLYNYQELSSGLPLRSPFAKYYKILKEFNSARAPAVHDDFWKRFGYQYAGPLLLGFGCWLIGRINTLGLKDVYFVSRDGYFQKAVVRTLSKFYPINFNMHYIYGSRRALNIPSIDKVDDGAINFLVSGTSILSVGGFLARAGINPQSVQGKIAQVGFKSDASVVKTGEDYQRLRALFIACQDELLETAQDERNAIKEYFESISMLNEGHCGLVDIGWHGSLQASIERLLRVFGSKRKITGFYLGTFPPAKAREHAGQDMEAYLCKSGVPSQADEAIKRCVELFEFIHSAPHGSVIRFVISAPGAATPVFEKTVEDQGAIAAVERMQSGALDYINSVGSIMAWAGIDGIDPEFALRHIANLLQQPIINEAVTIGNLTHVEGFGGVGATRYFCRPARNPFVYLGMTRRVKDAKQSFWREGFDLRMKHWRHYIG